MELIDLPPYIALFAIGAIIGSFLNVVIFRVPTGESIVSPPSHCSKCGHRIKPYENIPILSYIFLLGKCSGCKTGISFQYPIIEAITGFLLIALQLKYGWTLNYLFFLPLLLLLLVQAVIDFNTRTLIREFSIFGGILGFAVGLLFFEKSPTWLLGGGLLGLGLLAVNWYLGFIRTKQAGAGKGDLYLAAMIGIWLGPGMTLQMYLWASLTAMIVGLSTIMLKGKGFGSKIAFGPFLALGTAITLLFGEQIWQWYARFSGSMRP